MMTMIGIISLLLATSVIAWVHILAVKQLKSSSIALKDHSQIENSNQLENEKLIDGIKTALTEHKAYTDMIAQAAIDTKSAAKKEDKNDTIVTDSGEVLQFQGLDLFS